MTWRATRTLEKVGGRKINPGDTLPEGIPPRNLRAMRDLGWIEPAEDDENDFVMQEQKQQKRRKRKG